MFAVACWSSIVTPLQFINVIHSFPVFLPVSGNVDLCIQKARVEFHVGMRCLYKTVLQLPAWVVRGQFLYIHVFFLIKQTDLTPFTSIQSPWYCACAALPTVAYSTFAES
jgi:hypothetical protein